MKYTFAISICLIVSNLAGQCDHPDFEGLMQLYNATNEDGWVASFGWHQANLGNACNPCDYQGTTWSGVVCENDRVVQLNLLSFGLSGTLPDLELSELRSLSLTRNFLIGEIPDLSKLPNLTSLILDENGFTGQLPSFESIPLIEQLNLSNNFLEGSIPAYENLSELESFKSNAVTIN